MGNSGKGYFIITFGCQMNEHDSEVIAGVLQSKGFVKTDKHENADVIILNTCCVRETAENKVYGMLGRLRRLKTLNPNLIIGICGCMPQQEEVAKKIRHRFPYVDLIFGTHNLHQLPDLLDKVLESKETVLEVWSTNGQIAENMPIKRENGIKAWVTIMYGCNNFCTYCIVPYVRGRERSRLPEDIIREIRQLAREGFKEVTLLGQNVNSYGKDLEQRTDFADLLLLLEDIDGIERIRYMTSHPRDFTDKLINVISNSKKVAEHFHLPVQAGSNHVLKMMNRGYTREQYLELVEKIRKAVPNASITTDLMVGFPGETDEDFADTMDLVQKVQYDSAFTFIYNQRTGTPAARSEKQVDVNVKKERIKALIELQNKISLERNKADIGKVLKVLVEGRSKTNNDRLAGRSGTNKLVIFSGQEDLIGKLVNVKIVEASLSHLDGCLVNI
ncbi:tRNA (N6-isopentenyl adenosine(37)-C2)-methylthiotransferase MiaB [Desulfolucanica intricata]|uniref:tRNA (N6-isopentenyl adenosine(37)-C2)-methylthiotransferase MiaB n=1 Tax=Desulfolucanica intricata TaxID=1285191 RepID=UPI00083295AC|nr:tRNA (N6-isopentenyl adenosine(37)-C2)-methylthiotransferase MiaB [Desulfolucanica intricata]